VLPEKENNGNETKPQTEWKKNLFLPKGASAKIRTADTFPPKDKNKHYKHPTAKK